MPLTLIWPGAGLPPSTVQVEKHDLGFPAQRVKSAGFTTLSPDAFLRSALEKCN
jgi:hypothetical protein